MRTSISLLLLINVLVCGTFSIDAQTTSSNVVITGFTLVNSQTDEDITQLTIDTSNTVPIDLSLYGTVPLTIRCNVDNSSSTIGLVEFNIDDGRLIRTEETPPYYLGGDTDGNADEVNTLQVIGTFTLQVTVFDGVTGNIIEQQRYTMNVVDTSSPYGTLAPTSTPLSIYDVTNYTSDAITGSVNGELQKWHKITIGFAGPGSSETNNVLNPFTDYRLDVTFTHNDTQSTTKIYIVPGFYTGRGDAANSGESFGNEWLVHFRPDEIGDWTYIASFVEGRNVSLYNHSELVEAVRLGAAVPASFFDGATDTFTIVESNTTQPDLRSKGRLRYDPDYHHLQFMETGEFFLKAGADSPENFLAYIDFDNTPNNGGYRKDWSPHIQDFVDGNPTWSNGKGRGIIGAINYLSSVGMNVISFLTMNINGDDGNVFPYASETDFTRIDCSKTAQWDVVFDHAELMGMFLHFKTQETENDQLLESDGEVFGNARKLYYRELIARFGHHLALNWNLGEENVNTDQQRKLFSDYIKDIDPYDHPIVVHTYPGQQDDVYRPLLGYENFDGVSIQSDPSTGFEQTLRWVNESAASGRKWIVSFDEQSPSTDGVLPDADDPTRDNIRLNVLWANLMAGGAGVEYYFGYSYNHSDLTAQDYRSRASIWDQSRHALNFFSEFQFWNMISSNQRVTNSNWCLLDPTGSDTSIALFLPIGDTLDIDLRGLPISGTSYSVHWYDPRNGGELQNGTIASIQVDAISSIGLAPSSPNQDWAVLLKCVDCSQLAPTASPKVPIATSNPATSIPSKEVSSPVSVPVTVTFMPSTPIIISENSPSGSPSVGDRSNSATEPPSNSTGFSPSDPSSDNLPVSPTSLSNTGGMRIQSTTSLLMLSFVALVSVNVVELVVL